MTDKILVFLPHEPSIAQKEAGNYRKKHIQFQGMDIAVENPAGSVRRGVDGSGSPWERRMLFDYGYLKQTAGVDGDHVDCFVGQNPEAPTVYVVHARKYGDWEKYDEDKVMLGFDSENDARTAFLASYNDPRFLGPITAMPVDEFRTKALATKESPKMIKSVVLIKSAAPESPQELVKEHRRLVAVLRSPSHADDAEEADRQEDELEEYEADLHKAVTRRSADIAINYRLQMIAAQIGPLASRAQSDPMALQELNALLAERYTLMVAAGDVSI